MEIFDFSNAEYSNRNGSYGGAAGDKDGIGASFYPKKSTLAIEQILKLPEADQARNNANVQEPFTIDGEHHLNYRSILDLTESEIPAAQVELLKAAVISNTELVESKLNEIIEFVKSIPGSYGMDDDTIDDELKRRAKQNAAERYKKLERIRQIVLKAEGKSLE